mmetsp:Transcript_60258/g.111740  ORF Transcript_60258/g.111740 Transcript_60258/m.111740 type:complete len:348 (+) Transcript_60258:59-1102(+)
MALSAAHVLVFWVTMVAVHGMRESMQDIRQHKEVVECEGAPHTRADADIFFTDGQTYRELLGWGIFGLVTVLGEGDYRAQVFKEMFDENAQHMTKREAVAKLEDIEFGKTYQLDFNITDMLADIQEAANADTGYRYYFFTATDPAGMGHPTHFISYIVDKEEKKVHVFDPAEGKDGIGMLGNDAYQSDTEVELRAKFKEWGFADIAYFPKTKAPQTDSDDTYCQSWSLFLAIQGFLKLADGKYEEIQIPESRISRYEMLLNFWKFTLGIKAFKHEGAWGAGVVDFCEKQYEHLRELHELSPTYCEPKDMHGHESELLLRVSEPKDICVVSMAAFEYMSEGDKEEACS